LFIDFDSAVQEVLELPRHHLMHSGVNLIICRELDTDFYDVRSASQWTGMDTNHFILRPHHGLRSDLDPGALWDR
jgi:hypothetical protein